MTTWVSGLTVAKTLGGCVVIVNYASLRALRGSDLLTYSVVHAIKSHLEFKVHKDGCTISIPVPTQFNYKHEIRLFLYETLALYLTERGLDNSLLPCS